jgi:predicted ATPase/class 3 adenylate cyclase/DNA-binding CsgD family transcriptional regulator
MTAVMEESAAVGLPTGTVTLLLADIESSSRLWEERREEMASAVIALDAMVDDAVARHAGVRPLEQGEGDSFVAAFHRASDAVACAIDIQRRTADGLLRLRMGLHTGEVEVHDDRTYLGPTINRAARIRDAGHGGQVLLSQTTADLAADHLPAAATLVDRGVHLLRDLGRPEHVSELVDHERGPHAGTPGLRGVGGVPNNLGLQLTAFVGREQEMADVHRLLDEARLVTLTGAGGSGKTRMALQVAGGRLDRHAGGAWTADLSPVDDGAALLSIVASAVGLSPSTNNLEAVARHIGARQVLLIFDNCEHVLDDAAAVANTLLRTCPSLVILGTSREPLGVAGEVTYRMPSLDDADAVELFVERARRARPQFVLDESATDLVRDICARLEGMPLAIELAAARLRTMSPRQIRDGLNDRFRLLVGGARTAVPRHQTLQASVDWSYALLLDPERRVLDRLSVFAGGFTVAAAEAVCSGHGIEAHHVLDVLTQLVDKSLVVHDEDAGRFSLLETVRQYAAARLVDGGDAGEVRRRHYAHFLELVRTETGDEADARYRASIESDYDNIRRALQWADDEEDGTLLTRLVNRLYLYWASSLRVLDGQRWVERAAQREPDLRRRAVALGRLTQVRFLTGDYDGAVRARDESIAAAREAADDSTILWTILFAGQGTEYDADLVSEAIALAESLGDDVALAWALWQMSFHVLVYEPADVTPWLDRATEVAERSGATWVQRIVATLVIFDRIAQGELRSVRDDLHLLVTTAVAEHNATLLPSAVATDALVHALTGDLDTARRILALADSMSLESPAPGTIARANAAHAYIAATLGDWDRAITAITEAHETIGPLYDRLTSHGLAATLYALSGRHHEAIAHAEAARRLQALAPGYRDPLGGVPPEYPLAIAHRGLGDLATAEQLAFGAVAAVSDRPSPVFTRVGSMQILASVWAHLGRCEDAARVLGAIDAYATSAGWVRDAVFTETEGGAPDLCRAALGPERFEELYAAGTSTSWDELLRWVTRGRGARASSKRRSRSGWEALTPTERQVCDLVAAGASNQEVADRLFMSVPTVKSHLTHAFAKLGVTRRTQLAALAARD